MPPAPILLVLIAQIAPVERRTLPVVPVPEDAAIEAGHPAVIDAMVEAGARRSSIRAVLGPSIGAENYEVGPEFEARFAEADPDNRRFFSPSARDGHFMFDLPAYTMARLARAGVDAAHTGHCTYADEDRFFSYRRTTHRREPDYGRQISAIVLTD